MSGVSVRGNATAEELAAVLAVVSRGDGRLPPDGYLRWRAVRLAALRAQVAAPRR